MKMDNSKLLILGLQEMLKRKWQKEFVHLFMQHHKY